MCFQLLQMLLLPEQPCWASAPNIVFWCFSTLAGDGAIAVEMEEAKWGNHWRGNLWNLWPGPETSTWKMPRTSSPHEQPNWQLCHATPTNRTDDNLTLRWGGHQELWRSFEKRHFDSPKQSIIDIKRWLSTKACNHHHHSLFSKQDCSHSNCTSSDVFGSNIWPPTPWHQAGSQGLTQWHLLPRLPIGALAKPPNHQTTPPTAWQGKGNRGDCHIYATCAPVLYHADCGLDGADYS